MLTTLYCYILRYHLCEESHLLNTPFTRHNPYGISYISLFPVSQQHTGEIDSLYLIQPLTPTPLDAHLPWSQLHLALFCIFIFLHEFFMNVLPWKEVFEKTVCQQRLVLDAAGSNYQGCKGARQLLIFPLLVLCVRILHKLHSNKCMPAWYIC